MIVDSSVWIDYFRKLITPQSQRVLTSLQSSEPVFLLDVIYQEVLQGAKSPESYLQLQNQLDRVQSLAIEDTRELHRQAAMLYARCRWQGITIRSPNDCLIAAAALEAKMPVLTLDKDFTAIARIEPKLKLI